MTRHFLILFSTALFLLVASIPCGNFSVAYGNTVQSSNGLWFQYDTVLNGASKKRKKSSSTKKRKATTRTYTLRGNPDVTRRVATEVLVEKLPELARMAGIEVPRESREIVETEGGAGVSVQSGEQYQRIPTTGIDATSREAGYDDSELSESEDPDQLNADDDDDLADEEDMSIDDFYRDFTSYMASLNEDGNMTYNGIDKVTVMESLVDWLGTRYLFGGTGRSGIDCSAFTRTMYRSVGFQLPRTAAAQWDASDDVVERDNLQFGDLVFFNTRSAVYVSHVGMYLGEGMFAHASSRNGVTVSSLESQYYSTHFIGARRYDVSDVAADNSGVASLDSSR